MGNGNYGALGWNPDGSGLRLRSIATPESILFKAMQGDTVAETRFCQCYGTAIFCFFKARGIVRRDAEDLTQDVLLALLRGRESNGYAENILSKYDPKKGRFRPWLIKVLTNTTISYWREQGELIRKLGGKLLSLDFHEAVIDAVPACELSPEEVFTYQYWLHLHRTALDTVKAKCARDDKCPYRFEAFRLRYLTTPRTSWPDIAEQLGLGRTAGEARYPAETALGWYRDALFYDLLAYGMTQDEAEAELKDILAVMGRARPAIGTELDPSAEVDGRSELPVELLIADLLEAAGTAAMSHQELADLLGVGLETLSRWTQSRQLSQAPRVRLAALTVLLAAVIQRRAMAEDDLTVLVGLLRAVPQESLRPHVQEVLRIIGPSDGS